jgi:hypothetical protein
MLSGLKTTRAVVVALAAVTSPSLAGAQVGDVCSTPTFSIPQGSPFTVSARPGMPGLARAVVAGTFMKRSDPSPCECDLAVALGTRSSPFEGFVALMRGNEDGTFSASPGGSLAVRPNPVAIVAGPFLQGGSGLDGFAVVTRASDGNGHVQAFSPREDGTYHAPPTGPREWPTGKAPAAIATGDVDGDGRLDVAVANTGDETLTLLFGTGAGGFRAETKTVTGLGGVPESLATGKFTDGAGPDDIAVAVVENVAGARRVSVTIVRGSATGAFSAAPPIPIGELNSFMPFIAAADLTSPPSASGAGRRRDLALAFTDRTPALTAIGRVKVLLGRPGGGFDPAQIHDISGLPQSIKVSDIDDDRVVDLMVSTHSEIASSLDGTIRFFKGQAVPAADAGFHVNPQWFSIPESTAIRPRSLTTGRFGAPGPGGRRNIGVAVVNAPQLDSVSVFLGNSRGAFVQPSVTGSRIPTGARLFTLGDFHSAGGDSPLKDLAFVTTPAGRNTLTFLMSNGAGGFGRPPGRPSPIPVGVEPNLVVPGSFDREPPLDVAVIDRNPQDPEHKAIVKIFLGEGEGRFKLSEGVSEFFLGSGEKPVSAVVGRFRGPQMPLDIAIVSETSPSTGRLTILLNNGNGEFPETKLKDLDFRPGALAASNNMRIGGKFDLIIRDANSNRFLFLVNFGDARFRPAANGAAGFFKDAGETNTILIGNVNFNETANTFDDIVTFDRNMTVRVFINDGGESFEPPRIVTPTSSEFRFALPPYALADFGDGKLGLTAAVSRDGKLGMAILRGDGDGGFTLVDNDVELRSTDGELLSTKGQTLFSSSPLPLGVEAELKVSTALSGQLRSTLHGNNKPDMAFVTELVTTTTTSGVCVDDPQPAPPPITPRPPITCMILSDFQDCGPPSSRPCFEGPCCFCRTGHPHGQCPLTCDVPTPPPPPPPQPFCKTTRVFGPTIAVFGNTCAD